MKNWFKNHRIGSCQSCKRFRILVLTPSLTRYNWDGKGKDPNRSFFVCKDCSQEYIENMEDKWQNYNQGIL